MAYVVHDLNSTRIEAFKGNNRIKNIILANWPVSNGIMMDISIYLDGLGVIQNDSLNALYKVLSINPAQLHQDLAVSGQVAAASLTLRTPAIRGAELSTEDLSAYINEKFPLNTPLTFHIIYDEANGASYRVDGTDVHNAPFLNIGNYTPKRVPTDAELIDWIFSNYTEAFVTQAVEDATFNGSKGISYSYYLPMCSFHGIEVESGEFKTTLGGEIPIMTSSPIPEGLFAVIYDTARELFNVDSATVIRSTPIASNNGFSGSTQFKNTNVPEYAMVKLIEVTVSRKEELANCPILLELLQSEVDLYEEDIIPNIDPQTEDLKYRLTNRYTPLSTLFSDPGSLLGSLATMYKEVSVPNATPSYYTGIYLNESVKDLPAMEFVTIIQSAIDMPITEKTKSSTGWDKFIQLYTMAAFMVGYILVVVFSFGAGAPIGGALFALITAVSAIAGTLVAGIYARMGDYRFASAMGSMVSSFGMITTVVTFGMSINNLLASVGKTAADTGTTAAVASGSTSTSAASSATTSASTTAITETASKSFVDRVVDGVSEFINNMVDKLVTSYESGLIDTVLDKITDTVSLSFESTSSTMESMSKIVGWLNKGSALYMETIGKIETVNIPPAEESDGSSDKIPNPNTIDFINLNFSTNSSELNEIMDNMPNAMTWQSLEDSVNPYIGRLT